MKILRDVTALLMLLSVAGAAPAQQLEEIVVTAQKREQSLQDVGIAVTAFSAEQIKQMGFIDSGDIAAQTPGLSLGSPLGEGQNPSFSIRGVGLNDFAEHNEAPVAVYMDEVYLANLAGLSFQLFDLERIEVLKGPQGTLFGRNTTGGVAHFVTRKPTDEYEGYLEASVGEYSQYRFEGAFGGAITENLSGRISGMYNNNDGYREIRTPGFDDTNAADSYSLRGQLLFSPNTDVEILLSAHYSATDTVAVGYEHDSVTFAPDGITEVYLPEDQLNAACPGAGPGNDCFGYHDPDDDVFSSEINQEPFLELETAGFSGTINWQTGDFLITSISAYEYIDKFYGEDTDAGPVPAVYVTHPNDGEQFTQELRLAWQGERTNLTTGLYYFDRSIKAGSRIDISGIGFLDLDERTDDDIESWAIFGQLEYELTDNLTAIGGLRYTEEDRHFEMTSRDMSGLIPFFLGVTPVPTPGFLVFDFTDESVGDLTRQDDSSVSFRVGLDWVPADDWLVYGSIAQGSKGPGFNAAFDGTGIFSNSQVEQIPFDEETLTSYEIGFKSTIMDGRVQFGASAFYYDYNDYQAFTFEDITQIISNKDASNYGMEAELAMRPAEGWYFRFGLGLLDTEVKDVTVANFFTGDLVTRDREMVLAPDVKFSGLGRYEWPVWTGTMSLQADFSYQSKMYFDLNNSPVGEEEGRIVGNAQLAFSGPENKYQIALWVKNIGDTEYRSYAFPVTSLGVMDSFYARPRWIGATFSYNWQ